MPKAGRDCIPDPTARRVSALPFSRQRTALFDTALFELVQRVPDCQSRGRAILGGSYIFIPTNEMLW